MTLRLRGFAVSSALALCTLVATPGCGQQANPAAKATADENLPFAMTEIGTFAMPWSMAFLPSGKILVTQKKGEIVLFDPKGGAKTVLAGTPAVVSAGQGSMMDIVLAPDFAKSKKIYFSYSEAGEGKTNGVALATATLDEAGGAIKDMKVIFRATPYIDSGAHWSGRIVFSPDKKYLFFTNGERAKGDPAQDPAQTLGKVLRLNLDGTPAKGNPLAAKGFHPAIWSYGHRNILGLAFDKDGRLWEEEMGPLGGDEVNLIKPGLNYGWPKASNGSNYNGTDIPDHTPSDGFVPPKVFWNPSLAPASMAYYNAAMFPQWKNSLFITGLSGMAVARVALNGENASKADHWNMGMRVRSVRVAPDGALWLLEDMGKGRMLRLTPKK